MGALPALQFTLGQLWDERKGNRIDWDAYNKVGRPREALKRTAEAAFDSLSSEERRPPGNYSWRWRIRRSKAISPIAVFDEAFCRSWTRRGARRAFWSGMSKPD